MNKDLKQKVVEKTNLPKDVILGVPIVTMTGHTDVSVENYRGIQEYTECLIRLQTKCGQMKITGQRLKIDYYTNDEMKVTGMITSIEYC